MSQTSFGHNSMDTCTIPTVQDVSESPHEDLPNDAQNVSKQSVLTEISVNQCQTLIGRYLWNCQT